MLPDRIIRNIDAGEIVHALNKKSITVDSKGFNLKKFKAKDSLLGDWWVLQK